MLRIKRPLVGADFPHLTFLAFQPQASPVSVKYEDGYCQGSTGWFISVIYILLYEFTLTPMGLWQVFTSLV